MNERDNPYSSARGQMNATAQYGGVPSGGAASGSGAGAGLIGGAEGGGAKDLVKDTTTAQFTKDVIQESRSQPVLVDFWAPWCGPCRQLTPVLENAVRAAGGKVKLVKLNIDDHPAIPGQMGIQSIPAVIAFVDGRPADGFMGALPESEVKQFIDKVAGPDGSHQAAAIEAMLEESRSALAAGDVNGAARGFTTILQADPDNLKALAGMAECLLANGQEEQVRQMLAGLSEEQRGDPAIASLVIRMAQSEEVAKLGDPAALEARLAADPDDHAARRDLAKILSVRGERAAAADHLLAIMRRDRQWEDDGARKALLELFEAWGPGDPATLAARRKLSSILFS